ncbi:MAG TPA: glycosyltransferase family 4 protein [Armatimonadota bacterium]|nr:glycosyltransferase family 4 protein [Armatimonadota bacterium]
MENRGDASELDPEVSARSQETSSTFGEDGVDPAPSAPRFTMLVVGISWPLETFLARLFSGLADRGVEITIASAKRPDEKWGLRPRFRWLPLPPATGLAPIRLVKTAGVYAEALTRISRSAHESTPPGSPRWTRPASWKNWRTTLPFAAGQWDVIYFPWNSSAIRYLPLFDSGTPVIVSCRGAQVNIAPHNPQRAEIPEGLRETFRRAAAVHCVSEAIRDEAMTFGLDPKKSRVITPAVDLDFFRPDPAIAAHENRRSDGDFRIVTTGSLIWRKGYEYLLSSLRILRNEGVPAVLDIIGDGPDRQRIMYNTRDLDLEGEVRLLGRRSPDSVRESLQQADAFALSSLSEGISNAVLEAMACGTPVVTTDCGGMREAVRDGCDGFVTPVREPAAMASALEQLWRDPSLRRRMGESGRRAVIEKFSLRRQIAAFATLCESVIGQEQVSDGKRDRSD